MQDFAGSTVVHLIGATGALAALLLLGPRQGKYGPTGSRTSYPATPCPSSGLAVLILWFGWQGSTRLDARRDRRPLRRGRGRDQPGAAAGVLGAMATIYLLTRTFDIGMTGNGAIAGLVAITAPSGYVEFWAAPSSGWSPA